MARRPSRKKGEFLGLNLLRGRLLAAHDDDGFAALVAVEPAQSAEMRRSDVRRQIGLQGLLGGFVGHQQNWPRQHLKQVEHLLAEAGRFMALLSADRISMPVCTGNRLPREHFAGDLPDLRVSRHWEALVGHVFSKDFTIEID